MKKTHLKLAKGVAVAAALAAAATGCVKSEAERFGYKGDDLLGETNLTYLVLSPTVTNWVPERVLSIVEDYAFTPDELRVVEAAGVLMPGADYPALPEGYECTTKEPWFAQWTKPVKSFGLAGVAGVQTHYDEDRKVWETSESYFSSYWKTKEEALAALSVLEAELAKGFNVKKFHKFPDCWVAEYVRLCVMGVVGQKADGTWSCMLDIRDKGRAGCGVWEPVAEQQERLNRHVYMKEMKAWRKAVAEIMAKNAEAVAKLAAEKGVPGFADATESAEGENGRTVRMLGGACEPPAKDVALETAIAALWTNKVQLVVKSLGAAFDGEPAKESVGENEQWWSATWTSDLYEVRLDVSMAALPATEEPPAEGAEAVPPRGGNWRILYRDAILPGTVLPPRPQLKK